MLHVAVIHNGVEGTERYFDGTPGVRYRFERIRTAWTPDFASDDVIIVPNGADHVALYRARLAIRGVLDRGGVVVCGCGFFTPWVPGMQWFHDNSHPNRLVRYDLVCDPLRLLEGVNIDALATNEHGISGWWACGYIDATVRESVVLADTWNRAVLVADTCSTRGLIIASASGPLGEFGDNGALGAATRLYRNILGAARFREAAHG